MGKTEKERLLSRVEIQDPNGCWLWFGATKGRSNGSCWYGNVVVWREEKWKYVSAHRLSWELFKGPIPPGQFVLHTCDVSLCVNPDHMYLGSQAQNVRDREVRTYGKIGG